MRFKELWRTTTFRLTVLYGLVFALGTLALLGMVYWRATSYLTRRVDNILQTESDALERSPRPGLRQRLIEELTLSGNQNNIFALFDRRGEPVAGNLVVIPPSLRADGRPLELQGTPEFPSAARLVAHRLPTGETLVVGRDASQLQEMRSIITSALFWSGTAILLIGLGCGTALSIGPLRRLHRLQAAAHDIARGDLKRRMPVAERHDELQMYATTVNHMMDEVERLMSEVKGATEVIAHDLLSPLTNATLRLRSMQRLSPDSAQEVGAVASQIEDVLDRFRALLRIAELDSQQRRGGFARTDLADVVTAAWELYQPLAESTGVRMLKIAEHGTVVDADPKLLLEALGNLIDNAIKFAGRGSTLQVRVGKDASHPKLIVQDDGPGIADSEKINVAQRFHRGERSHTVPGTGLGLSVVAAIVRLHGFVLRLEDADPGLRVVIDCENNSTTQN